LQHPAERPVRDLQRDVDGDPARDRGHRPGLGRPPRLDLPTSDRGRAEHGRPHPEPDRQGGDRPARSRQSDHLRGHDSDPKPQSAPATYTLAVGPAINDLAGNAMARRATATTVVSLAQTFTSTNVGQTIWDFGQVASAITVNQDIAISDLNVTVNVSHTYDSD